MLKKVRQPGQFGRVVARPHMDIDRCGRFVGRSIRNQHHRQAIGKLKIAIIARVRRALGDEPIAACRLDSGGSRAAGDEC